MRPLVAVLALCAVIGDRGAEEAQEVLGAPALADAAIVQNDQAAALSHEVSQTGHRSRGRRHSPARPRTSPASQA